MSASTRKSGFHAARQGIEVVAAFEAGDDAPALKRRATSLMRAREVIHRKSCSVRPSYQVVSAMRRSRR